MAASLEEPIENASPQFGSDNGITTVSNLAHSGFVTAAQNASLHDGCVEVRFSEMEFLPWDNPDNIVSAEIEAICNLVKDNVLALMLVIGGPANVINMAVFYRQSLKERVNLCLFALALADELYLLGAVVLYGEQIYSQFITTERFGPVMTSLVNSNFQAVTGFYFVSPVLSAIIALERCYCVLRPLKFQTVMHTRTMAAIIVTVYLLVLGLYFIVVYRYRIGCVYDPDSGLVIQSLIAGAFYLQHRELIDFLDSFIFGFGLPGVVITVVVISTVITAVKLRQVVTWRAGTSSSISPKEIALTKMLIGNSILFIACLGPVAITRFTWVFFPEMAPGRRYHNFFVSSVWISELLSYFNASLNIFVYYAMGSRYRQTFWALFNRKQKPEKA